MAGAKSGVHVVQLKPISVPKSLVDGNKFIKWDDDSNTAGTPVTLRVDKKGFFLYWTDQNQETDFLEISSIRDARTGKYARLPREGRLRDSVTMGAPDVPLEDKTITVVYGPDLVNVSYVQFCCFSKEVAQEWTDEILKMAYNLLALNTSSTVFLEKAYIKLTLETDRDGKIPVKCVYRMFAQHKDDKKRVERALEACGLPGGKNDAINPELFTLDTFFTLLKNLTVRGEVERIFESLCGGKKKAMTVDQLVDFLNKEQRDPRLNEILYPYANHARGMDILKQYEPNKTYAQKGLLSLDGFLRYLMSEDNMIVTPEKFDLNMDMDQPLSHYFINSSHNTYLTGHQLTGRSSVEIYRQCLLTGCRCVELDCWNGKNSDEEPIITHGYTVVTDILLKEVLEAIAECAFKTSSYPVILSFENHCSPKQQAKIASHCQKIFGDMLQTDPLPSHQLKPGQPLPSPQQLMRKIIIKNKKKHYPKVPNKAGVDTSLEDDDDDSSTCMPLTPERLKAELPGDDTAGDTGGSSDEGGGGMGEGLEQAEATTTKTASQRISSEKATSPSDDSESESVSDDDEAPDRPTEDQNEGTAAKESEAGAEMSALVNYIQPVRFHSFEHAEKRNRSYEVSSFVETHSTSLLKEHPVEFVNYNKRQLSRIYPKGTRVDSSNYMPQVFWNAGCQMVALNFQTLDLGMQLNLGIFEYNARSGYLLKPDFMRRNDRKFDPFTESTVDGIIAGTVQIKIISGQFLTDKRVGTYVEVDMYGLPTDTVRRRFRTKTFPGNSINPVYDEDPFIFKKVVLPDLAVIRFAVYEENNRFIGHRILPVVGLRPGYRHISLRNECGQPLTLPSLFVHITVKDYVPDGLSDFADALVNPIAYQSMVEKHANQLLALTDDIESEERASETKRPKSLDSTDLVRRVEEKGRVSVPRSEEEPAIGGAGGGSSGSSGVAGQGSIKPTTMNGSVHRPSAAGSTSPIPVTALSRTDTVNKRHNQSIRSLSDDGAQEKAPNLLESAEADIAAEPLEKIKEHKMVLKVFSRLEKDIQALRRKHEKIREREKELQQQKEEKLMKAKETQKTQLVKTHSKLAKRCSAAEAFFVRDKEPSPRPRQILKRKSEVDIQVMGVEHQTKLQDLNRTFCQTMQALSKEQFKAEMEVRERYQEQVYSAVEKSLYLSQSAQIEHLKSLHDREVNELMKRLEAQTKEEMRDLGKKHKDKNELARIKRELNQKLIDQAVAERQKIMSMLDKKMAELKRQHIDIKKRYEDEKSGAREKLRLEYEQRCAQLSEEYQINPNLATTPIMENPEPDKL